MIVIDNFNLYWCWSNYSSFQCCRPNGYEVRILFYHCLSDGSKQNNWLCVEMVVKLGLCEYIYVLNVHSLPVKLLCWKQTFPPWIKPFYGTQQYFPIYFVHFLIPVTIAHSYCWVFPDCFFHWPAALNDIEYRIEKDCLLQIPHSPIITYSLPQIFRIDFTLLSLLL